jgi:hypothetical protein
MLCKLIGAIEAIDIENQCLIIDHELRNKINDFENNNALMVLKIQGNLDIRLGVFVNEINKIRKIENIQARYIRLACVLSELLHNIENAEYKDISPQYLDVKAQLISLIYYIDCVNNKTNVHYSKNEDLGIKNEISDLKMKFFRLEVEVND